MKLNRNRNQRKALVRTQLNALVTVGHLTTTEAKARLIKPLFDRLITRAKKADLAARRLLAKELASVDSANRLVDVIAPLFTDKVSGYTTSQKVKIRRGDGVTLVALKLTADVPTPVKEEKKKAKVEKPVAPAKVSKAKVTKTAKAKP